MEHTVAGAIKEWRKHNKVIGQVKISYKKILRKCRELSLAGGKYREYQGLCAKYQCARLTAVTKGLVPFEDNRLKRISINGCQNDANWILPMVH